MRYGSEELSTEHRGAGRQSVTETVGSTSAGLAVAAAMPHGNGPCRAAVVQALALIGRVTLFDACMKRIMPQL